MLGLSIIFWLYCLSLYFSKRKESKTKNFGLFIIIAGIFLPAIFIAVNVFFYLYFFKYSSVQLIQIILNNKKLLLSVVIALSSIFWGLLLIQTKNRPEEA
jgi:hypothetical protein